MKQSKNITSFYPYAIATYPIISLLGTNIGQISGYDSIRSLVIVMLAVILLNYILRRLYKDNNKAALTTSIVTILFFTYGHVFLFLRNSSFPLLARHRYLFIVWGVILIVAVVKVAKVKVDLTRNLNIVSLILLLFPLYQMGYYVLSVRNAEEKMTIIDDGTEIQIPADLPLRDIYYIILDSYSREDILRKVYDYDNSEFINELEQLGFFVGDCSQSNYPLTQLSVTSSLNMSYLQDMDVDLTKTGRSYYGLWPLLHHSKTRNILEELGYEVVAFETQFNWANFKDADVYLTPYSESLENIYTLGGMNEFEELLLDTTILDIFRDAYVVASSKFLDSDNSETQNSSKTAYDVHRERALFKLEQLNRMPKMPGPKFVYAHIIVPHAPFIFGPNGEPIEPLEPETRENNILLYRDQVIFINSKILSILKTLINETELQPIIIIQGDHGGKDTIGTQRSAILNAYYFPEGGNQDLYDSITPVNTFRYIFDRFYGMDYPLLDDVSYRVPSEEDFSFDVVIDPEERCLP